MVDQRDIIRKAIFPYHQQPIHSQLTTFVSFQLYTNAVQVGHERSALTSSRTLESLYINPILDTLSRQNPLTPFAPEPTQNGIFDTDASQTLYFFIDLKTDGPTTWPAVLSALEPLRAGNHLSTYDGTTFTSRAVTVIGTGNTPLYLVQAAVPRDAFYDAPLALLDSSTYSNVTANDAPIASTDFAASFGDVRKPELNETQLATLRAQIGTAAEKGIMARYWNQPQYPIATRNAVWKVLWEEGVGLLNADDVAAAAAFWEGTVV